MSLKNIGNLACVALVAAILIVAFVVAAFLYAVVAYFSPAVAVVIAIGACLAVIWRGINYFAYYF